MGRVMEAEKNWTPLTGGGVRKAEVSVLHKCGTKLRGQKSKQPFAGQGKASKQC